MFIQMARERMLSCHFFVFKRLDKIYFCGTIVSNEKKGVSRYEKENTKSFISYGYGGDDANWL